MVTTAETTTTQSNLHITQQNWKHCISIAQTPINTLNPNDWDLVLLQEPYIYPNTHLTMASRNWVTMYPTPGNGDTNIPKSVILVSDRLNLESYQQITIPSIHVTGLRIHVQNMSILVLNVYNPPKTDLAINALREWLARQQPTDYMIWAGDFNKHDALWLGPD